MPQVLKRLDLSATQRMVLAGAAADLTRGRWFFHQVRMALYCSVVIFRPVGLWIGLDLSSTLFPDLQHAYCAVYGVVDLPSDSTVDQSQRALLEED